MTTSLADAKRGATVNNWTKERVLAAYLAWSDLWETQRNSLAEREARRKLEEAREEYWRMKDALRDLEK